VVTGACQTLLRGSVAGPASLLPDNFRLTVTTDSCIKQSLSLSIADSCPARSRILRFRPGCHLDDTSTSFGCHRSRRKGAV